jgi:GntR family transcriptional regulator
MCLSLALVWNSKAVFLISSQNFLTVYRRSEMQIRISKQSEIPIREQIAEQIIFRIATDELKPGQVLPSVRELARRLKIHHNTVSHVYADLVRRGWLARRKGRRLIVRSQDEFTRVTRAQDLDAMINAVIRVAREGGHSLQELRQRVRERLLAQPPDHLLVIDDDPGLRQLLQEEIRKTVRWPLRACSQEELRLNRGRAVVHCRSSRNTTSQRW